MQKLAENGGKQSGELLRAAIELRSYVRFGSKADIRQASVSRPAMPAKCQQRTLAGRQAQTHSIRTGEDPAKALLWPRFFEIAFAQTTFLDADQGRKS
jgi:hypothetical protein